MSEFRSAALAWWSAAKHLPAREAIAKIENRTDVTKAAASVMRARFHSAMLGALDVNWEVENDKPLPVWAIAATNLHALGVARGPLLVLGGGVKGFSTEPFDEAVDAFFKRVPVTKAKWKILAERQKKLSFTAAGLAKESFVSVLKEELAESLVAGLDQKGWIARVDDALEDAGASPLSDARLVTIFRTNVSSAYGSGRIARHTDPDVLEALPVWEIRCVLDRTTRPTHAAAHGVRLLASDPFWTRAYPPFGFRCRCTTVARRKGEGYQTSSEVAACAHLPDEGFTSGR